MNRDLHSEKLWFSRSRRHDLFAESLEDFLAVVVEVAIDLFDRFILNHPQLTVGVSQQPLVVRYDYNTCNTNTRTSSSKTLAPVDSADVITRDHSPPSYSLMASASASIDSISKLLVGSS